MQEDAGIVEVAGACLASLSCFYSGTGLDHPPELWARVGARSR